MIQPPLTGFLPESTWQCPEYFPEIWHAKSWSVDIESRDPNLKTKGPGFIRGDAQVVGVGILPEGGLPMYFPVRHAQGGNLAPNLTFSWLAKQASQFRGELYGANLLYDLEGLWYDGVKFNTDVKIRDVQIAQPLIDEETSDGYSLEKIAVKYLGQGKEETLLREAAERFTQGYRDKRCHRPVALDPKRDLWQLPPEYVGAYVEGDVDRPLRSFALQRKILEDEGTWRVYELEASLTHVLLQMRLRGIRVDLERAHKLVSLLTKEIDRHAMEIHALVGFHPNLDSGPEVLRAYRIMNGKFPSYELESRFKYTQKGNASFTADWYAGQVDPLSKAILKKKKLMTLRDDFVLGDILGEQVRGRIHAQFNQLRQEDESGTRSGRFSSVHPNLQQIPARHDEDLWGKDSPNWAEEVRSLFIPDDGSVGLMKSDYSAQEPRLTLHFAAVCDLPGSQEFVEKFHENPMTDFHQLTCDVVNKVSGKSFKRKQIKDVNLGLAYGMGLKKLCAKLGVTLETGKEILKFYHLAVPFMKGLSNKAMKTAQERGNIRTILGRLRHFNLWEPVQDKNEEFVHYEGLPLEVAEKRWPGKRLQRYGVHKALNALIQGSAADQGKEGVRIMYYEHGIVPQILVHDEVVTSVSSIEQAYTIKNIMETAVPLCIPVVAEAWVSSNWGKKEMKLAA